MCATQSMVRTVRRCRIFIAARKLIVGGGGVRYPKISPLIVLFTPGTSSDHIANLHNCTLVPNSNHILSGCIHRCKSTDAMSCRTVPFCSKCSVLLIRRYLEKALCDASIQCGCVCHGIVAVIVFHSGLEFKHHPKLLRGNNDILNLTKPDLIVEIHKVYAVYVFILLITWPTSYSHVTTLRIEFCMISMHSTVSLMQAD